jgi:2-polyprenyl-6-methoxyphenol hydroxylase-like FAD-dependent oxidoreductase
MSARSDLLVVGAGPTGLALALQAHAHGARVRIIERRPDAFRPSRAMVVHPRTLEVLRPLAVVDALLDRADTAPVAWLHLGSRVLRVGLSDVALAGTAFPHLSVLRQMDVETVLAGALAERGVRVERGVEFVDARSGPGLVQAVLRSSGAVEQLTCGWVVGCDGAGSTVRGLIGGGWRGGPYRHEVVLADVELSEDLGGGGAHVAVGRSGLLFAFAAGERARWRLLGTRPCRPDAVPGTGPGGDRPDPVVGAQELQQLLDDAGLPARVGEVAWAHAVRLQYRLADRYRNGRLLVAGDAAHTHSPAAAQGMNTGLQDAANLGWKLAFAAGSSDPETLVDSYEAERRVVARQVLALTHHAFWAEASTDRVASFLRGTLAPLAAPAVPWLLQRRRIVDVGMRLLSQMQVSYHGSPLSPHGGSRFGRLRAGDRLPDATVTSAGRRTQLHALLARPGVHLLLQRDADDLPPGRQVHVHRLENHPGTGVLAVRPDGYLGPFCPTVHDPRLAGWLALVGIHQR